MLDERKEQILRAVVQEYIETAQPVGSQHVARSGVQASAATIRNEMAVLERDGYLTQPHTSSGRIPTDKGYRFFVDHLPEIGTGVLKPAQRAQVRDFFSKAHFELEHLLGETSQLLSRLTHHTAVLIGPPPEQAVVRSAQLVALGGRTVLAVAVLSNGVVEKRTLEAPVDDQGNPMTDAKISAASTALARQLINRTLTEPDPVNSAGDPAVDTLLTQAVKAFGEGADSDPEHLYVGGASRMAADFEAADKIRRVLGLLEQQFVVVTLLRDLLDRGLSVAIGVDEHGLDPLAECTVVVAPVTADGENAGTIGLLAPTRMNYPHALAAVAVVSQRLGKAMAEG